MSLNAPKTSYIGIRNAFNSTVRDARARLPQQRFNYGPASGSGTMTGWSSWNGRVNGPLMRYRSFHNRFFHRREPETIVYTSAAARGEQPEAARTCIPARTSKEGHITVAGGEGP